MLRWMCCDDALRACVRAGVEVRTIVLRPEHEHSRAIILLPVAAAAFVAWFGTMLSPSVF